MDLIEQLNHIFYPKSIAVVGASDSPGKVGFTCMESVTTAGFQGEIYPVNPNLSQILGLKVYPSVGAIPGEVDIAIIAIPAQLTVSVVEECATKGVVGIVMLTGGFGELGTEMGLDMQERIADIANKGGVKIVGPNCMGIVNPRANLNATFAPEFSSAKPGAVGIVSQSGGLSRYLSEALTSNNVGISKSISVGNRCNLDFDEVVEYLAQDEDTKVIILYIEGLGVPRRFMTVAGQAVRRKPVVAYKVGRVRELNQASLSHTGTLAGEYQYYTAAFNQAGMITVDSMTELLDVAKALAFQPPSTGNRVAIVSSPAGGGIIMADKCYELGLRLAEFSPDIRQRLRQSLSPLSQSDNPIDMAGVSSNYDTAREVLKVVMEDDCIDMIAAATIYSYTHMSLNQVLIDISGHYRKPIVYVCIDSYVTKGNVEVTRLEENNIPVYPFPERAVTALAGLYEYGKALKSID